MIYAILLLGLILRRVLINQSFWLDEAASLSFATLSIKEIFVKISSDFHPPLYYLLLHYWLKLGIYQEWFLRLPNILFSLLTILYLYKFVKLLSNRSIALIAALLLALNPLHIYYSQELRMYALNIFLTLASWYYLYLYLKQKQNKNLFSFILFTTLNLFTFYGTFLNLFTQFIFVTFYHRQKLKQLLLATTISVLPFLLFIPTLIKQINNGSLLTQALPGWSLLSGIPNLKSLLLIPLKFSLGRLNLKGDSYLIALALLTTILYTYLILRSLTHKVSKPLFIILLTPLILGFLISFKFPMLGYWRYLYLLPPFTILISLGLSPHSISKRNFLFIALATLSLYFNYLFWRTPAYQREDWRQAISFAQSSPDSISIFAFPDAFAPVKWYAPNLSYVAPLPQFASTPRSEVDSLLSPTVDGKSHLLYFEYLSPLSDPQGHIASWLHDSGYILAKTHDFPGVGLVYDYVPKTSP